MKTLTRIWAPNQTTINTLHLAPHRGMLPHCTVPLSITHLHIINNTKHTRASISSLSEGATGECLPYRILWVRTNVYWEWAQANYTTQNTNQWPLYLKAYHSLHLRDGTTGWCSKYIPSEPAMPWSQWVSLNIIICWLSFQNGAAGL